MPSTADVTSLSYDLAAPMKIVSVDIAAFGPLANKKLTFVDELNVVYGPNESAKTAIHAALFAGLCGIRRGKGQPAKEDFSLKHGVFTHYLLKGLDGEAADKDGQISVLDLYKYTSRETKFFVLHTSADKQTPVLKGEITNDFVLAVRQSERKPEPRTTPVGRRSGRDRGGRQFKRMRSGLGAENVRMGRGGGAPPVRQLPRQPAGRDE